MGLNYSNLNESTRRFMVQEFERGGLFISPRLAESARHKWAPLLKDAIQYHTDVWLERELIRRNCFVATEYLKSAMGKTITRAINKEQCAKTLAEGEFNRFYLRGLCLMAKERGLPHLIVCQGRGLPNIPPGLLKVIGTAIDANGLLQVLRANHYAKTETALGLNALAPTFYGLTARLPVGHEVHAVHVRKLTGV